MEAERVSEVLRLHDGEITWESHLAVVELLSTWLVEQILDFQETLLEHLATGRWTNTSRAQVANLGGTTMSASRIPEHIAMLETLLSSEAAPEGVHRDWMVSQLEQARAWQPDEIDEVAVPPGHIAVPLHPWAQHYGFPMGDGDPARNRRKLASLINDAFAGDTHDTRLLLRAAPWAYHRVTGQRLAGVIACRAEEFYLTGRNEWFTTVVRLRRGADRVEYLAAGPGPSKDYAAVDQAGYFAKFARSFGAKVERIEARPIDGVPTDEVGWFVQHGQVISDLLTEPQQAPSNALSESLRTALFSPKTSRAKPSRMEAVAFWKLISLIDDELSDESVENLVAALAKKPLKSITGFHETLTDQLHSLDRPELTKPPGGMAPSAMSDDVFLYFRCAVVAAGPEAVASVLGAGGIVEDDWRGDMGESLLTVAPRAWELKTGDAFDYETELSYETASNAEAWGRPPTPAVISIAAHSVRSTSLHDGAVRERVRFWSHPVEAEAREAHDAAERELWADDYQGIIDVCAIPEYESLSVTAALGRVSYFRPLPGGGN